jgi:hypothetical protein
MASVTLTASFKGRDSLQNQAARQAARQHRQRVFDRVAAQLNTQTKALWQIHADEISFGKMVGFLVSRFKKNSLIARKRNAVVVFPR